jgi:hypothetical protein
LASSLLSKTINSQSKVNDFLESVARNSIKSKAIYGIALSHFQTFLNNKYGVDSLTLETIIVSIAMNEINVYSILDNFVSYLLAPDKPNKLSSNSISLYVAAVRSFLQYHDIDISSAKFKRRVRLPKKYREDEEDRDASDIRRVLLLCNNRRIKAYLPHSTGANRGTYWTTEGYKR